MKIGIVTTWFERGAAMVSRAYRDVLAQEHKVYIFARGGEAYARGDPRWDNELVTWATRVPGSDNAVVDWREFRRWVLANQLDILIFNEQLYWPLIVFARRHLPCLLAAYVDYYKQTTVPFFQLYDLLLCNTERHFSVFRDHPGALLIPWGCDLDVFSGSCEPVDPGKVVFFHSCGMSPGRKGTLCALRAFEKLRGDCRFLLHIQAPLDQHPEIAEICSRGNRIEVVSQTVSAPGLYHRGDVYVYPTILEGIGLTIIEALACGLPVIAPDAPPMNEFVRPGENGSLVQPYEYRARADAYYWATCHCHPEAVAKVMQEYVDHSADLAERKKRARASAEERLNWKENAKMMSARLQELVASPKKRPDLGDLEKRALEESLTYTWRGRLLRQFKLCCRRREAPWLDRGIYG